jgi:Common central domain of tyrosinase/von Willebrand factor type A domain
MALGDGIRRNILSVSQQERDRFRDAIIALNNKFFPGSRTDFPAGGVSYWFKQDEIHQATHVHGTPAFLPWHRELCNRFEAMLREVDPDLSLHYWDWNQDPTPLLTPDFMGSAQGDVGPPWLGAGLYNPNPNPADNYRDNNIHGLQDRAGSTSYELHSNPADPPQTLTRATQPGAPPVGGDFQGTHWATDMEFMAAGDFPAFDTLMQFNAHGLAHGWIGGNLADAHMSFRDPFVFLLHSNVDRLWATWQTQVGHPERLDPNNAYGSYGSDPTITAALEPWAGEAGWQNLPDSEIGHWPTRPWYSPENQQVTKTSKHSSVVIPACYDTLPTFPTQVALQTPSVVFNDVPAGETAARAVVLSVRSCHDVALQITDGPNVLTGPAGTNFGVLMGTALTVQTASSIGPPLGRFWISYKGTNPGDMATGSVTVSCAETNQTFVIPISANTIARPTVATMLVLDQSGSMGWLAGIDDHTKRIDVLHQAAMQFVQLVQDSSRQGDGVGMVSFDNNAYPGVGVTKNNGTGFDLAPVITAIQALQPQGATSIGAGLQLGRNTLNPVVGYDQQAIIVFTDGLENTAPYIADVQSSINDRTFAIGLGTAQQVSVGALTALVNNTGGSMLLSGNLSPAIDDYFRLSKYFMQVLAGVQNSNIVTDPSGYILPGMKVRIPFVLNDADIEATVILLTDLRAVRFLIETPKGDIMTPAQAPGLGASYGVGTNLNYYRFTLPLPLGGKPAQAGTWHALLELDDKLLRQYDRAAGGARRAFSNGVRYNLSAHAFSNLRFRAGLLQNSLQPGATLTIRAALSEYGIPLDHRASVYAMMERPDTSQATIGLTEIEPGIFEAATQATMQGVYRFHVIASGVTMRGLPFTREQQLSGAAVIGGDNAPLTGGPSTRDADEQLCQLLECLLGPNALGGLLSKQGIDPTAVRACIERWCKQRLAGPSAEELRQREGTSTAPSALAAQSTGLLPDDVKSLLADILSGARPIPSAQGREPRHQKPRENEEC